MSQNFFLFYVLSTTCTAFLMSIYFCQHSKGCHETKIHIYWHFLLFYFVLNRFLSVRKASMPVFHSYLKLRTLFSFYSDIMRTITFHQLPLLVSWFLFPKFSLVLNKAPKITKSKTHLRQSILLKTFDLRTLLTSNTDFQY